MSCIGECAVCVWFSLGWAVTVRPSGAAAPGGPRVASPGVRALRELPLLPATLCRLAVSAARRRAARLGAQLQSSLSLVDAATHLVNRLFFPIAMAAATSRARERQW